jgi:hypothetical protein
MSAADLRVLAALRKMAAELRAERRAAQLFRMCQRGMQ